MAAKRPAARKTRRSTKKEFSDLPSMDTETEYTQRRSSGASQSEFSGIVREFISSPTVRYVAGGIASAMLARLATKISEKYPELSNFLRENIDTFEGRLAEFKPGQTESQRH
jgi:hypothetical protein